MAPKDRKTKIPQKPPISMPQPDPQTALPEAPDVQTPPRSSRVAAANDVNPGKTEHILLGKTLQTRGALQTGSLQQAKPAAAAARGEDPKERAGDRAAPESAPSRCNAISFYESNVGTS